MPLLKGHKSLFCSDLVYRKHRLSLIVVWYHCNISSGLSLKGFKTKDRLVNSNT